MRHERSEKLGTVWSVRFIATALLTAIASACSGDHADVRNLAGAESPPEARATGRSSSVAIEEVGAAGGGAIGAWEGGELGAVAGPWAAILGALAGGLAGGIVRGGIAVPPASGAPAAPVGTGEQ